VARSLLVTGTVIGLLMTTGCLRDNGTAWGETEGDSLGIQVVVGANSGSWDRTEQWTLEQELAIGEPGVSAGIDFGNIGDVEVGPDGTIYVLDRFSDQVLMFDERGISLGRFGGDGEGPGDLSGAVQLVGVPGQGLVAVHPNMVRLTRFDWEGVFLETIQLPTQSGILVWAGAVGRDRLLIHQARQDLAWNGAITVDLDSGRTDTLVTFPEPVSPFGRVQQDADGRTMALMHSPILAGLGDGRFVTAMSDEAQFEIRESTGGILRIVRRHAPNPRLTPAEQDEYLESLLGIWESMFRMEDQPEDWIRAEINRGREIYIPPTRLPALTGLLSGPARTIWLRMALPVEAMTSDVLYSRMAVREFWSPTWEVFTEAGTFLGEVSFPPNVTVSRIVDEHAYGIKVGEDFGVEYVVKYRIVRPGR